MAAEARIRLNETSMQEIGIRQARVFLAIADCQSITRAARVLSRSQTSVTKSLHELERQLGEKLFDRTSKGVRLTAFGECLLKRAREAADAFGAASELVPPASLQRSTGMARFFRMDVSERWLDAFLAVAEHQNIVVAAEHLGLGPAAVSSSLRKLEEMLTPSLFERTPTAVAPTPFGRELSRYVKLARSHLRSAGDEIAGLRGVKRGRLVVGTLPLARTIIVPKAIARLLKEHRHLDVSTVEGPYDDLIAGLRCGDIDLVIGALRENPANKDLLEEPVFSEGLSAIVRAGHPLVGCRRVQWQELLEQQWILPRRGTPTRTLFEKTILGRGLALPLHIIETSSLVTLRGLLLESDRITVLSRHQVRFEEQTGLLATLPLHLGGTERPVGITRRRLGALAPAAELLASELRKAAAEFFTVQE